MELVRILLVEDNAKIAKNIKDVLEHHSFSVDIAEDGEKGERLGLDMDYDLIILDIMLPKRGGKEVCVDLRADGVNTPILMLTALGELEDKVEGLDSGADDYLVKPFAMQELLARIRALLRRPDGKQSEVIVAADITLNPSEHLVKKGEKKIALTIKEYAILEYLVRNKGSVVSKEKLLEHCWDFASNNFSNIVEAQIKALRKKLSKKNDEYIETVRGVGYRFRDN